MSESNESGDGRSAFITLASVIFTNVMGFGMLIPLLPFYAESFQAPPWQIALVFSAFPFGGFFGEPIWGRMSDRIGRKPLLISTVCATSICYFMLAFAPNIYLALIIRFLGGFAAGNNSVIQSYLADVTPARLRSGRIALLGAANNIGFIIGPAVGGLLVQPNLGPAGFRLPFLAAAALSACSVIGIIFVLRETRAPTPASHAGRFAMLARAMRHPRVSRFLALTFFAGFAFTAIQYVFGLWAQRRFGWGPHEVGYCFVLIGIASALTNSLLTGPLSQRFGEVPVLAAGLVLTALSTLLLPFSDGSVSIMSLMALMAVGQASTFPNAIALISRYTGADHQGQILGLNSAASQLARLCGPFCAALAFSHVGADAPLFLAAFVTIGSIYLAFAPRRQAQDCLV